MAVAQKAISRGVSETEIPTFDLNHCRSSSMSEIMAIGVLQTNEASRTRSSKACSGSVSRIAYLWRASTRAASFFIGMGVAMVFPRSSSPPSALRNPAPARVTDQDAVAVFLEAAAAATGVLQQVLHASTQRRRLLAKVNGTAELDNNNLIYFAGRNA